MNLTSSKQIIAVLCLLFVYTSTAFGQEVAESRKSSYLTYIYQIADKEAKKIYAKNHWNAEASYFHTLVDSFPTDQAYDRQLPKGHYLKTFAKENKQQLQITTIQEFDVFIFNNNTDLCIQVYDLKGNRIEDAAVNVRQKKLRFNATTKSYIAKKSNQKGLLEITYNGFTCYYPISRKYNNSFIKRGTRKVLYSKPIRYVWIPVKNTVFLPIDGVKSLVNWRPVGSIYKTKRFFIKTYNKIACLVDPYYYNCNPYKFQYKHTGYLVFNKPKYLPGDTVKLKAFLVSKKGKPINKEVAVILEHNRKETELATLNPYRKGGYSYEFYLHDSLQLKLDKNYTVRLQLKDDKEYIDGDFRYEDYELSKNKLEVTVKDEIHYRNKDITLIVSGKDENDLNLLDARIEVLVKPRETNRYFDQEVFIPDTLFYAEQKLHPTEETEVNISSTDFPKANMQLTATVRLLTSDNEVVTEQKIVTYKHNTAEINIDVKVDSIHIDYLKNGQQQAKQIRVYTYDNFDNQTMVYNGKTPATLELNPFFSGYDVFADSLSKSIAIANEPALIQCFSERTKDSIFIEVLNPRKIPFHYNIYRRNSQQALGFTDSLTLHKQLNNKQNYYVSLRYLWGGKVTVEDFIIPYIDKKLNIAVSQPKIVYPGQKTQIELHVTDAEGQPVPNVDITAYSLTKKFAYNAPQVPYLGKSRKDKTVINNFEFEKEHWKDEKTVKLNYNAWKALARIDSIEYYKFIYPENGLYQATYQTKDKMTQFAPFVVSKGEMVPIHVIYVDNEPVYFSWSTNKRPYSFKIGKGKHQIKIRTSFKEITIDNVSFENGKKTILSIDENSTNKRLKTTKTEGFLSTLEQQILYKYIVPYKANFGEHFAFIEQRDNIQLLTAAQRYQASNLAGPIIGEMTFQLMDNFSTTFYHEPFYEYRFSPSQLKLKGMDQKYYPKYLYNQRSSYSLTDEVLTKETIEDQWSDYLDASRIRIPRYGNPTSTSEGAGRLQFKFKKKQEESIKDLQLNVLVFKNDDHTFLRVYPGNTSYMHDLQEGLYKLIFFYSGQQYHVEDSLFIQPNGLNYFEFNQPDSLQKDAFSIQVSDLIEQTIFKPNFSSYDRQKELDKINNTHQQQFNYFGEGRTIEGYLYDEEENPLIFANVIVKGTTYGTTTNLDGYYSINVPTGKNTLVFSYIGYTTQEYDIGATGIMNAILGADENVQLDEIVVTAMGISHERKSLSYAATTIEKVPSKDLQFINSVIAGVSLDPNDRSQFTIRGTSTVASSDKQPLFIINGNVFMGDISELDPSIIEQMDILEGKDATALYGARASNGVVLIKTKPGTFKPTKRTTTENDERFLESSQQYNSIRDNFSDYAFWQPRLTTDKNGKATFEVEFPDDVTSWETHYLAMNGNRQSGQSKGLIKSYKPLMAQLALPRFLVQSDTTFAIGKSLNYRSDSAEITTTFEINGAKIASNSTYCTNALIDTLSLVAHTDSLSVKYYLETKEEYFDGEKRDIPVFPKGLEETKGHFYALAQDTSIQLQFDPSLGSVKLYAKSDVIDVVKEEISHLVNYKYYCNEQIASKLKVLLAEKKISTFLGEKFKQEKTIGKLIRLLQKNQKGNGLWAWWRNASESMWISLHVLEAIVEAEKSGYKTSISRDQITESLLEIFDATSDSNRKLSALKILALFEAGIDFKYYISEAQRSTGNSLNELLRVIELQQLCNIKSDIDTLTNFQKTTMLGNIYYSDKDKQNNIRDNAIQNTILAYKILRADSTTKALDFIKMRNFFLENRGNGHWRNTYESAQIIETILPDLLKKKSILSQPTLALKGTLNKTISEFPFETTVTPDATIEISKSGDNPVYFTSYQRFWNKQPAKKTDDFEISTHFKNTPSNTLAAGKETKLVATVEVKKASEYVMINIPIPGGCSYANKHQMYRNEVHREYFKNETAIFCKYLSPGTYTFTIDLIPRYAGVYTLNPAKIELMYFPTMNANNQLKTVTVE